MRGSKHGKQKGTEDQRKQRRVMPMVLKLFH